MNRSLLASGCPNALTIDVEDYFQVSAFEHRISRADWDLISPRVVASTERMLELFADVGVRGTFFVLGWVAERFPKLIAKIHAAGHELASHGYSHELVYEITPQAFREDVKRSREAIGAATGVAVTAYRAPSFSICHRSLWALEILAELGFTVDSSIFPVRHDRYGIPNAVPEPHRIATASGTILEFPPSVWSIGRFHLPIAGGGYFRLYPLSVTKRGIAAVLAKRRPFMFYLHPWEIDPDQPRMRQIEWRRRWRHRVGLRHTETKLRDLLKQVHFDTLSATVRAYEQREALETVELLRTGELADSLRLASVQ